MLPFSVLAFKDESRSLSIVALSSLLVNGTMPLPPGVAVAAPPRVCHISQMSISMASCWRLILHPAAFQFPLPKFIAAQVPRRPENNMSHSECSISSFEFARLEAMDSQRFDISQKRSLTPRVQSHIIEPIPSTRDEDLRLEGFDNQRSDIPKEDCAMSPRAKAEFIPSARDENGHLEALDNQRFDISKKECPISIPVGNEDPEGEAITVDTSSERSRRIAELWKALTHSHTHSIPVKNDKLQNYEIISDECSALMSESGNLPGSFVSSFFDSDRSENATGASTPATSDNGHSANCDTESIVKISDDATEVRITDHILRWNGTTTGTIVRPVPRSASSCSLKSPVSRPTSPLNVLKCWSMDSSEKDIDVACEEREKCEGEVKIFVKEEVRKHREQLRAPFQELQPGQDIVKC
ncbi:hypothetical protein WG66_010722 [Moniliophthora roreri]|nr:hypothetical protein WG66_010722 [Moniliophthora roreri]